MIDSITLLRVDESMTTVWDNGFCQFQGSAHYRPGAWQSRISAEQFQWLASVASSLGQESSKRRTASQSLIITGEGREWRIEEQAVVGSSDFWIVSSVIDGIVSRAHWAPLDISGELDFYGFSLEPSVYLDSGESKARGHAANGGVFVLAGAVASTSEAPSLALHYQRTRQQMIETQKLQLFGDQLILCEHVFFDSPSKAACVLTGSTSNGRQVWKTAAGDPIGRLPGYSDYS
ncbi:DUF4357 domain-containing protein [Paenarthrobacter ureafaciens]|uniref:DUF4357 domain-containing protein n=1 Tax=Paenarthrobacter ureafaciens TaxID=37931 RepID=UPI002DB590B3|nr:DUF4357 domain-containing protein [Paenarthrobacter ureafaciens]MEC3853734.1 DUF4357 domain-containing protein [Paenarthrobacter ureafaciens]